jgi:hypothetical protein
MSFISSSTIHNVRIARVIGRCSELPGHELFQYVDDEGVKRTIESSDVNAYIKEISGADFTAKDFRTWVGTVLAVRAIRDLSPAESATQATKHVVTAVKQVAERLGNTASVCRKCYIHPAVLDTYLNRDDWDAIFPKPPVPPLPMNGNGNGADGKNEEIVVTVTSSDTDLDPDVVMTLAFLRARPAGDPARTPRDGG